MRVYNALLGALSKSEMVAEARAVFDELALNGKQSKRALPN